MPLYEYQCLECGHRSEELQRLSDPPLATCPACGGRYQKQLSAPAFQFKGSGWYVTDYARSAKSGEGKGGDGTSGDGKAGDAKGGDAKAASGEAKPESPAKAESAAGKTESKPAGGGGG